MRRKLPFFFVFLFGTFMVVQYFVPHEISERAKEFLLDWIIIIGIFALALGIWSLIHVSVDKINKRKPNWEYAFVTLVGLVAMIFFGFTANVSGGWWTYFAALIVLLMALWLLVQGILGAGAGVTKSKEKFFAGIGLALVFTLIAISDKSWAFHFY